MKQMMIAAVLLATSACGHFGAKTATATAPTTGDQPALAAKLATLKAGQEVEVFCRAGGKETKLVGQFYGDMQDMLKMTVPDWSADALAMECGWTRSGPSCEAGELHILFHQFGGGTVLSKTSTDEHVECEQIKIG